MAGQAKTVQANLSPVLTVVELCDYLRIHKSTLYRIVKANGIPWFRVGSEYRFNRQAIDEWRRAQEHPAPPPKPAPPRR